MIKAMLFDFDDTLGDREKYARALYCEAIEKAVPKKSTLEKEALIQKCMVMDQQGDINKTYIEERLKKECGVDIGPDFNDYWEKNLWRNAVCFPDAKDTLQKLRERGYLLGIVSNGDSEGQRKKLQISGVIDFFDAIVISGDYPYKKPDPRLFLACAEKLHVQPEECVMTGDLFFRDVIGALDAGMEAVWIWTHGQRQQDAGVRQIAHLSELLKWY